MTDEERAAAVADVAVGGVGILRFILPTNMNLPIFESQRRGEAWEPFESLVFRLLIDDGTCVCDIGANVGWYSIMAAKLGASVAAVALDSELFDLLKANVDINGCEGVAAGCIDLSAGGVARTIDLVVGTRTVDVLKLDAQGNEERILRGATSTLAAGVGAILIRFRAADLLLVGTSAESLLGYLGTLQLSMFEVDPIARALLRTTPAEMIERSRIGRYSAVGGEHLDLVLLSAGSTRSVDYLISERTPGRPLADLIDPEERRRVELTVSCPDTSDIPKVHGAGSIQRDGDHDVQIMHNGVKVVAGGYYGQWMSEIISRLKGHHEPQEELVFHQILERLSGESYGAGAPVIVELGAFWSYYALWFMQSLPGSRAVLVEPDPSHLAVASANLALNDRKATIIQAAVGDQAKGIAFNCEGGETVTVDVLSLFDILDSAGIKRADLVVSDIQGAEARMLELACGELAERVRFLVLSTHHASISGHWDTHERCLSMVRQCGGHIIAEHDVSESFSGDGLIAASFDPRDRDMHVRLSAARANNSLFPVAGRALDNMQRHAANLEQSYASAVAYARSLEEHRTALQTSVDRAAAYARSLEQRLANDPRPG